MDIEWSVKKRIALIGLLTLPIFVIACLAVPMFVYVDPDTGIHYGGLVSYFIHAPWGGEKIFYIVAEGLTLLCFGFSAYRLIRSVRADPDVGDDEDRHFVFGFAISVLGFAIFAMACFAANSYIPMAVGLLGAGYGIVSLIVHFRKLSSF
ncbi:MAG: hypothetical protein K6E59_02920 [Bacilli bacterium]|nr:hypothetical protein [Bacilli bacterium]